MVHWANVQCALVKMIRTMHVVITVSSNNRITHFLIIQCKLLLDQKQLTNKKTYDVIKLIL